MRRALLVVLVVSPAAGGAQATQRCAWSADRQRIVEIAPGLRNYYFGGNVVMRCPEKEIRVQSDSVESYEADGRAFLIGSVRYREPRLSVDSDYMTYFQREERVVANGNVNARLPNGSTLVGPVAEYLRATPQTRPVPRLHASGRPTITLVQRDSTGQPTTPATVLANTVTMVGDSLVFAGGRVVVTREDIIARGDSVTLDSEREVTVLMRSPSIEGRRERPFRLAGQRIELTGADRRLRRVVSTGTATATSEDLTLASDSIDLRVADDLLQRAVAWGASRARATSPTQSLVADSIDVTMPGQRLREIHAVRGAAASGQPDTTRFRADTVDWMRGDTIVALFDTVPAAAAPRAAMDRAVGRDTASRDTSSRSAADSTRTRLRELHAVGNARSFYHLAPADSAMRRPAINYVTGREIVVAFQDQQVARVTVVEQASGVYLEPTNAAPADSARPPGGAAPAPTRAAPRLPAPTAPRPGAPVRRPE